MAASLESQVFGILFEHGSEAVFMVDRNRGTILVANSRLEDLIGRSRHSLIGSAVSTLFAADSEPEEWARQILANAGLREEVPLRRVDDYSVYVTLTVAHIDHEEHGALAACVARDTTERRRLDRDLIAKHSALMSTHRELEAESRRLHETRIRLEERNRELGVLGAQLAQSAHRAAIGEFSAGIAHSMNNPMGAALSAIRQIEKRVSAHPDGDLGKELERFIQRAQSALGRMESIVAAIRRAHQSGQLDAKARRLHLAEEIDVALALFDDRVGRIEIVRDFDERATAWGPSDALHHVLSNLIDNAIQAMPRGGTLTISATPRAGKMVIAVRDTGGGVPAEIVDKLFDPFFSQRSDGSGTGLGLCLAQRLARQWNGDVTCTPAPSGACFEVMIPSEE